jgi:hypothetical protein
MAVSRGVALSSTGPLPTLVYATVPVEVVNPAISQAVRRDRHPVGDVPTGMSVGFFVLVFTSIVDTELPLGTGSATRLALVTNAGLAVRPDRHPSVCAKTMHA